MNRKKAAITWTLVWMGCWILVGVWMHQIVFFNPLGPEAAMGAAASTSGWGLLQSAGLAAGLTGIAYAVTRAFSSKKEMIRQREQAYADEINIEDFQPTV